MIETSTIVAMCLAGGGGYLLGGVPFGLLIGKLKGVDIREHGSGNIGATNAARVLGRRWFAPVFALDFGKGWGAVALAALASRLALETQTGWGGWKGEGDVALAAGVGACLGHIFPIYLRLRGGKAVATALGVLVGLVPLAAAMAFAVFVLVLAITRYVSLASMVGALMAPLGLVLVLGAHTWVAPNLGRFVLVGCLGVLVVWRHRSNFGRILRGTESRVGTALRSGRAEGTDA